MYRMKEEDARKTLASLRQAKCSIEKGIMILERLIMQSDVQDAELCGDDPDDYLSEWVTPKDDNEPEDSELYEMYTFPYEMNSFPENHSYAYYDCAFCEECDCDEP